MRKLSGINFNYNYRLYLVLSKFPFTKIWSIQEYKQPESWSNKNYPHMFWIYWICSTPSIISNTVENTQILVTCFSFYIISNFYIIFDYKLLRLTSLKNLKLWHYYTFTMRFYYLVWLNFPFKHFMIFRRISFTYWYFDTNFDDKESLILFLHKKSV